MKSYRPTIHISRAVVKAGLDLSEITQLISMAVWQQAEVFGAQSEVDISPEEIHMDFVIVRDHARLKYYKAGFKIDKTNNIKFSDVQEVQRKWTTVKSVERSEDSQMIHVYWVPPTTWGNVLMRTYE